MGLLDGLIGGIIGAELVPVINGLIERHGGVHGIVTQLEQRGLGPTARSWVGTGPNQPITAEQVQHAFGADALQELAGKAGLTQGELASKLAALLPQAIDKLTPTGSLPPR